MIPDDDSDARAPNQPLATLPIWLTSIAIHLLALIALALLTITNTRHVVTTVEAAFVEKATKIDTLDLDPAPLTMIGDTEFAPIDMVLNDEFNIEAATMESLRPATAVESSSVPDWTAVGIKATGRSAPSTLSEQVWYTGAANSKVLIDFSGGSPSVRHGVAGQSSGNEGTASYTEPATGKLVLYTDGITLFDGQSHSALKGGQRLTAHPSTGEPAMIIPVPGADHRFYVFTNSANNHPGAVSYSLADTEAGKVTIKNRLLARNTGEALAIVPLTASDGFWFILYNTAARIDAYLIDERGIASQPISSSTGFRGKVMRGSIVHSGDFGNLSLGIVGIGIATAAIDRRTGRVSNVRLRVPDPRRQLGYSTAFSPDGSKLYFVRGTEGWSGRPQQLDLDTNRITQLSRESGFAGAQLAPDGKIYWARFRYNRLGVVHNPNELGARARFHVDGIYLGRARSAYNLPVQTTLLQSQVSSNHNR